MKEGGGGSELSKTHENKRAAAMSVGTCPESFSISPLIHLAARVSAGQSSLVKCSDGA